MSMDPSTRQELEQRLVTKRSQLAAANAAYEKSLTDAEVASYTFDSGEGKQAVTLRSPESIRNQIEFLEREIRRITQRLTGAGVCTTRLRREW